MINVDKINGWIRTDIAMILAALASVVGIFLGIGMLFQNETDSNQTKYPESCYGIYGSSGRFYPSAQTPYRSAEGLWYVINHETWDAVGDFEALHVDRECLRRRYSDNPDQMVPPVEGVDK